MNPVLQTGDRVELVPVKRTEVHCGDILVFTAEDGRDIIHRVIRLSPLQTRGDNCGKDDPAVPECSLLYRAAAFRRNGRSAALTSGNAGVREFRRSQRRRRIRLLIRKAGIMIANCNVLRIPFRFLSVSEFPGKEIYYAGKYPVGWFDDNGRWHWMRFARFFVKAPPGNFRSRR